MARIKERACEWGGAVSAPAEPPNRLWRARTVQAAGDAKVPVSVTLFLGNAAIQEKETGGGPWLGKRRVEKHRFVLDVWLGCEGASGSQAPVYVGNVDKIHGRVF